MAEPVCDECGEKYSGGAYAIRLFLSNVKIEKRNYEWTLCYECKETLKRTMGGHWMIIDLGARGGVTPA